MYWMDVSCEILLQAGNRCHVISHLDHVDLFFYLKKPATQAMKTHVTRGKKKRKEKKNKKYISKTQQIWEYLFLFRCLEEKTFV